MNREMRGKLGGTKAPVDPPAPAAGRAPGEFQLRRETLATPETEVRRLPDSSPHFYRSPERFPPSLLGGAEGQGTRKGTAYYVFRRCTSRTIHNLKISEKSLIVAGAYPDSRVTVRH